MPAPSVAVGVRRRLVRSAVLASWVGGLSAATGALSQNLVVNGEFDVDVATWQVVSPPNAQLGWDTVDHDGCGAASGSAEAINDAPSADFGVYFWTCVTEVTPGAPYSFEFWLRFPAGQAATGSASTLFQWYDSTLDCDGNFVGNSSGGTPVVTTATPGVWLRTGLDGAVAPVGAHSAGVRVTLFKETAGQSLLLRYDGVHVVQGSGILLLDGFEIGSTCRWSSAAP